MYKSNAAGFLADIGHRAIRPINVVGGEVRNVALRATEMPAQLVEVSTLWILLALDDAPMFFERDCPLGLMVNRRPETSWKRRLHEPAHCETEVMELSQMDVGADRARLEAGEQMFRSCLENHEMPDQIEGFLPGRTSPSNLCRAMLGVSDRSESILPRTSHHARIRPCEIGLGELQIQVRLPDGFVTRVNDSHRRRTVTRLETFLFARFAVLNVEPAALLSAVKSESDFHAGMIAMNRRQQATSPSPADAGGEHMF